MLQNHTKIKTEALTSGSARCIKRQHCLDGNVHGWDIEGLKHDLEEEKQQSGTGPRLEKPITKKRAFLNNSWELLCKTQGAPSITLKTGDPILCEEDPSKGRSPHLVLPRKLLTCLLSGSPKSFFAQVTLTNISSSAHDTSLQQNQDFCPLALSHSGLGMEDLPGSSSLDLPWGSGVPL